MKSKNFDIDEILSQIESETSDSSSNAVASLMGIIYRSLLTRDKQIILECGVNKGFSTSIFSYYSENYFIAFNYF